MSVCQIHMYINAIGSCRCWSCNWKIAFLKITCKYKPRQTTRRLSRLSVCITVSAEKISAEFHDKQEWPNRPRVDIGVAIVRAGIHDSDLEAYSNSPIIPCRTCVKVGRFGSHVTVTSRLCDENVYSHILVVSQPNFLLSTSFSIVSPVSSAGMEERIRKCFDQSKIDDNSI